jgi:hypothetical protein
VRIEFFYSRSEGPTPEAEAAVREAIEATGVEVELVFVAVDGAEDAKAKRCLGAPTIRVDGVDVEYGEREPDEYQAGARYYNSPQGWKRWPHARMVANAILEAQARAGLLKA